ncbi:hypothetical protein PRZ48_013799 [Zasmidium cellare]|uniref:SET domain-containing protein n=1 Tax=Zasmidium cellare TaxID=395010 RepID=A0ABR0E217_ZASCE|nr:hypothetical protein PRZ48_013799 [Zasmidium cellare]
MTNTSSRKRRRTSTLPQDSEPSKHDIFTQWCLDRGVQIQNVKPAILPGRGVGLITTAKIKQDDRIMFVPEKPMFKPDATVFGKTQTKTWTQKASPQVQLAMSIMQECRKPESQYHKWKATWPTPEELLPTLPLFWSKTLQSHLPPSLQQPLERQRLDYEKDLSTARSFANEAGVELDEEDFKYHWSIVNSRSFHFKPPGARPGFMVLCPFVDYMNHGPSGTGVKVSQTPKGYEVDADRDYEPGTEILATYGAHPNDKLLIHYGFTLPTPLNPDDDIRLDSLLLPAMSSSTTSALQDVGFLGGYALLPATNELCFKTQVAVRAMLLTANEWEYFIANGEDLSGDQSGRVREWVLGRLEEFRELAVEKIEELEGLEGEDKDAVKVLVGRWRQILEAIDRYEREGR